MAEKEHFSDPRQAEHVGKFASRANLGKSTKQVDEDLQAFKEDVLSRLDTISKMEGPVGPKGDKGDPGKDGKDGKALDAGGVKAGS